MNTAANRPIEGVRAGAERALRWWLGELRAAYGDAARHVRTRAGNTITIEAGEQLWRLRRGKDLVGNIECEALAPEAVRQLLGDVAPANVTVEIPPERVLSKTVALPAGAQGQLDRVLGFEIARHFPFAAERVFFGYRVMGRSGPASAVGPAPLTVEIAAVPREIVFAVADDLAACGLRAGAFALVSAPNAAPLLLAADPLIPAAPAAVPNRRMHVAVGLLALAAVISWPIAQQVRLAAIEHDIAALKPAAEAALRTRSQQQRAADQTAAIDHLRGIRPPLVSVLDLLTREVPDGAWLTALSVNGRDVVLDGLAPSAAAIALVLQRNPAFADISFRSPIARDTPTGPERFQLGATLTEPKR